jgi:hypothetical protein
VEANDLSTSRRELEWRPFLLPIWPEIATVAHESERPYDEPVVIEAVVAFDTCQILSRLQADLDMPK